MIVLTLFLLGVGLIHSEDKFPDNLQKCGLKDQECLRKLYQQMVHSIGEKGIPELKIPPVDPIELKNVTVSILGLLDITLVKGVATGISTCVYEKFLLDLTKESVHIEITCSLKVEGRYKLKAQSPLIKNLLGSSSVYGDGNGKAFLDKVHLIFDYPVYAQKRSDGEIYMNCEYKKINYNYEVQGGAKFYADDIHLGDQEVSKEVIPLLNENWRFVMGNFGRPFVDKAMEFYFYFAKKFFDVVPARYYILDDLTPYAKS